MSLLLVLSSCNILCTAQGQFGGVVERAESFPSWLSFVFLRSWGFVWASVIFSKFIDLTIFKEFLKCMIILLWLLSWQPGHLPLFLFAVYENKIFCPVWHVQKYRKRVLLLCREETPHSRKNGKLLTCLLLQKHILLNTFTKACVVVFHRRLKGENCNNSLLQSWIVTLSQSPFKEGPSINVPSAGRPTCSLPSHFPSQSTEQLLWPSHNGSGSFTWIHFPAVSQMFYNHPQWPDDTEPYSFPISCSGLIQCLWGCEDVYSVFKSMF